MTDPRLVQTLEQLGAEGLISADPGIVRMLTGHVNDIETGPSVFALPAIVIACGEGSVVLVCSADEAEPSDAVVTYEGFTVGPIERVAGARRAVTAAIERSGGLAARWAIDGASVPVGALPDLGDQLAPDRALAHLTAVKTPEETAAIEAAIAVCDAGQAAARDLCRDGVSELELWHGVRAVMETRAGARIPVLADLVSGVRSAGVGGAPGTRKIASSDLVLIDLVPRVAGVWGDSCATFLADEATAEQRAAHAAACAALELGLGMLRPGARSGDIDAALREALASDGWDYPHHTGHGVGFSWHEEPRIVPDSPTVLEPGMIVALEPGTYSERWGLRVEQVALVTETGPRVLSGHALALEQGAG
jgi:Xaa-Pro aminopeptidase